MTDPREHFFGGGELLSRGGERMATFSKEREKKNKRFIPTAGTMTIRERLSSDGKGEERG